MAPQTKITVANSFMAVGLLPFFAALIYLAYLVLPSDPTGDAAVAAGLTMMFGFVIAYVAAFAIAFPAFLWSSSLAKSLGSNARCSIVLRKLVVGVVCSVFLVFAFFAFVPFFSS